MANCSEIQRILENIMYLIFYRLMNDVEANYKESFRAKITAELISHHLIVF